MGTDESGIDPTLPSSVYLTRSPHTSARRTGPPSDTCQSGHTQGSCYRLPYIFPFLSIMFGTFLPSQATNVTKNALPSSGD